MTVLHICFLEILTAFFQHLSLKISRIWLFQTILLICSNNNYVPKSIIVKLDRLVLWIYPYQLWRLSTGQRSFAFRGAKLWNSLNDNNKSLRCPKNFCTVCKYVVIFLNNLISNAVYDWIILTGGNTCERHLEFWIIFFFFGEELLYVKGPIDVRYQKMKFIHWNIISAELPTH